MTTKTPDEIQLNTSAIKQEMQEFEKIAYNKACEDIIKLIDNLSSRRYGESSWIWDRELITKIHKLQEEKYDIRK